MTDSPTAAQPYSYADWLADRDAIARKTAQWLASPNGNETAMDDLSNTAKALEGPWRVVEPFAEPPIVVAQYDELRLARAHALREGLAIIGPRYEQLTGRP
jgi:hypothetical protein